MKQPSITSLPPSPEADRHARMLKYSIAMAIRLLCIVSLVFVRGWWMLIPAIGAVFLPYFAVVIANAAAPRRATRVEGPGAVVRRAPPPGEPPSPGGDGS